MTKAAAEHIFTGVTGPIASYDKTKTLLGTLMTQNTGAAATDKWAGPRPIALARPMEQSVAIPGSQPFVVPWSNTIDWVFLADAATAAITRRIVMYEYDKVNNLYNWKGFITLTFANATGTKTIRGMRCMRTLHTTGTVTVSGGTGVVGSGTQWQTERLAFGARIGFGTTDPTQVTQWYTVGAVLSEGGITLVETAPDAPAGTPYVIEELRIAVAITSSTAALGSGLFLVKGLNPSLFTATGTAIPEAASNDNEQGIYWLANALPVTNLTSVGLVINDTATLTNHDAFVLDGTTTLKIFKYNLRAALSGLTFGKTTSAFVFATGTTAALTGTLAASFNGRVATALHGPGNGVKSIYFVTGTRVYRAAISGILNGSTTFINDGMVEIPPGSVNTFPASGALSSVDYITTIDRFVVMSTGAAGTRSYVTQYNAASNPFDHIFLLDTKQQDQSAADGRLIALPSIGAAAMSLWTEAGVMHIVRSGITAAVNQMYALPLGADWQYAATTNQRIISPEIMTPNAFRLTRAVLAHVDYLGADWAAVSTDPVRVYARTSGIDTNLGAWTLLDSTGSLSALTPAASIQFMFEFRTIGWLGLADRIHSINVIYEDATTDSHYQVSLKWSSAADKQFAWRLATAWGSVAPTLKVQIYDAVSGGGPLVTDTTTAPTGVWEKSTDDGLNWTAYDTADKINETTYIRYTPASLPDNIKVRALLTQA